MANSIKTTKAKIRKDYIELLQSEFDFYTAGSRALDLAHVAVDAALDGTMKNHGKLWQQVLIANGLPKAASLKVLQALPDGDKS